MSWVSTILRAAGRAPIPKDKEFFARAGELKLKHAKLTAFGSTRFAKNPVEEDRNVRALIDAGTPVGFASSARAGTCTSRARSASPRKRTCKLISETVAYLKDHGREVVYDAEHFFDGYTANPDFALRTLEAAQDAPAPTCSACATPTAARSPAAWSRSSREVRKRFDGVIGIHTHNDSDVAVANTIAAVEAGATHVQGCMNGYGERCGNANLASVIANLELKLGHTTIGPEKLANLAPTCRFIAELANLPLRNDQPFVGQQRLRAQGRRARQRRAEGFRHLRAHHARSWSATGSACW